MPLKHKDNAVYQQVKLEGISLGSVLRLIHRRCVNFLLMLQQMTPIFSWLWGPEVLHQSWWAGIKMSGGLGCFWGLWEESAPCLFQIPAAEFLGWWPLLPSSQPAGQYLLSLSSLTSASTITQSPLILLRILLLHLGSPWRAQDHVPISILQSPCCHVRRHGHRFWRLEHGCLWDDIFLQATPKFLQELCVNFTSLRFPSV